MKSFLTCCFLLLLVLADAQSPAKEKQNLRPAQTALANNAGAPPTLLSDAYVSEKPGALSDSKKALVLATNGGNDTSRLTDSLMIISLEHRWVQVAMAGDADAFADMMADNYVGLYPDGRLGRKASWVSSIRSGKAKYEYVRLTDLQVYLNGSTAVVTGRYDEKAFSAGKERLSKGSYMSTWAKINGQWKIVANAFTDDPPQ